MKGGGYQDVEGINENSNDHDERHPQREQREKERSDPLRRWLLHRCCNIPRLSLYILSTQKNHVRSTRSQAIQVKKTQRNNKKRTTDHLLLLGRPGTYTSSTSPRIDSQLWWPNPITIPICRQCLLWWWLRRQSRRKYPINNTIHSNITIFPFPFFPSLIDIHRRTSSHNHRRHFC